MFILDEVYQRNYKHTCLQVTCFPLISFRLCESHNHTHTVDITKVYYTVFPMPHVEEANKIIVIVIVIYATFSILKTALTLTFISATSHPLTPLRCMTFPISK